MRKSYTLGCSRSRADFSLILIFEDSREHGLYRLMTTNGGVKTNMVTGQLDLSLEEPASGIERYRSSE